MCGTACSAQARIHAACGACPRAVGDGHAVCSVSFGLAVAVAMCGMCPGPVGIGVVCSTCPRLARGWQLHAVWVLGLPEQASGPLWHEAGPVCTALVNSGPNGITRAWII